jgi:hypothetical protein
VGQVKAPARSAATGTEFNRAGCGEACSSSPDVVAHRSTRRVETLPSRRVLPLALDSRGEVRPTLSSAGEDMTFALPASIFTAASSSCACACRALEWALAGTATSDRAHATGVDTITSLRSCSRQDFISANCKGVEVDGSISVQYAMSFSIFTLTRFCIVQSAGRSISSERWNPGGT